MSLKGIKKHYVIWVCRGLLFFGAFFALQPGNVIAEIIWSGDYETGNFRQWHLPDGTPYYWGTPQYGRPARRADQGDLNKSGYYGDGTLVTLVTDNPALIIPGIVEAGPVREGSYSAKFTVKSEAGGGVEPNDCDYEICTRRRTYIGSQGSLSGIYNALPYLGEKWVSFSAYVPSDWDSSLTSGFGVHLFGIKSMHESRSSGPFSIDLKSYGWELRHINDYTQKTYPIGPASHVYLYTYNVNSPYDNAFDREARDDFPNIAASQAALASVNKGGWTDWIIHAKWDERGPAAGGTGLLKVWKREDDGAWIQILDIQPKTINRSGVDYDRGIGYYVPPTETSNGGYVINTGMYMSKDQVWSLPAYRVIYNDNIKVGNENATFGMMSPDGSKPDLTLKTTVSSTSPTTVSSENSISPPKNLRVEGQ